MGNTIRYPVASGGTFGAGQNRDGPSAYRGNYQALIYDYNLYFNTILFEGNLGNGILIFI
jgi:hypothetical protein